MGNGVTTPRSGRPHAEELKLSSPLESHDDGKIVRGQGSSQGCVANRGSPAQRPAVGQLPNEFRLSLGQLQREFRLSRRKSSFISKKSKSAGDLNVVDRSAESELGIRTFLVKDYRCRKGSDAAKIERQSRFEQTNDLDLDLGQTYITESEIRRHMHYSHLIAQSLPKGRDFQHNLTPQDWDKFQIRKIHMPKMELSC